MKLDELHIADLRARVASHCHAVSRGGLWIGRVAIDSPHASRGQQNHRTCHVLVQSLLAATNCSIRSGPSSVRVFTAFRQTQTVADSQRILQVQADFVFTAERGRGSALCTLGRNP